MTESNQTDRLLSWPEVRLRIPLSRGTVWAMRRSGTFPDPVRISAARIAWRESDLAEWVNDRARAGNQ